jgi:addiction module RelE/StbE family toxin
MRIRWTTPATKQLAAAHEFIAADNTRAARKIATEIWKAVDVLAKHPEVGRKGRVAGTRELVVRRTPFVVAYRIEKDEVQVLAVWHAARKWPKEF